MNMNLKNNANAVIAKIFGIDNVEILKTANPQERDQMIAAARKRLRFKDKRKINGLYAGNPYLMLGRKITSEGKQVK